MRAVSVRAIPAFALCLALALPSSAETDPIVTGDPPLPGQASPQPPGKAPPAPRPPKAQSDGPPATSRAVQAPVPAARAARPEAPAGTPLTTADEKTKSERLDALFTELKRAASHETAAPIAARIEEEWGDSGSATVDLMMLRAGEAMAKDNSAAAFDFLEQAIILKPDYPEAWNRRATLNYATDAYGKSLVDIEKTLALEPRHWGALMGLGMILEETDRKAKALETYMKVLDVYPAMKGAQDAVGRLSEELTGQAI